MKSVKKNVKKLHLFGFDKEERSRLVAMVLLRILLSDTSVLVTIRHFLQPLSRVRAQLWVKPFTLLLPRVRQSCL